MKNTWGYGVPIIFIVNIIMHVKNKGSFFNKQQPCLKGWTYCEVI